jgi:hypothetical protein
MSESKPPFSMLIHAIERDLERTPEGNGGEVYYFPATEKHGSMGHNGEYLLREWREVTADLAASVRMHGEARVLLDQTLTERDQAVAIIHDCERDMKALRGRIHDLTADRDRALAKLSDAEEDLGNEIRNHEITKNELDKAWTKIHFADHGPYCSSRTAVPEGPRYPCDCWKSHP